MEVYELSTSKGTYSLQVHDLGQGLDMLYAHVNAL